jgi:hypothetical protein
MLPLFHWIQNTSWATSLRQADLLFPLIEGSHILALSFSVGLILMLDLRLLGMAFRTEPVSRIMSQVMPWALPGFAVMFVTGLLLFFARPESVYTNRYFRVKVLTLALAGLNAAFYQYKYYPRMAEWDKDEAAPVGPKIVALVSLVLWVAVIVCGRLTAYEL